MGHDVGRVFGAAVALLAAFATSDVSADKKLESVIRDRLETKGDRVTDLHLWQVGPGHRAAVISVISDRPLPPATYKRRLGGLQGLCHVTVEVELCPHHGELVAEPS